MVEASSRMQGTGGGSTLLCDRSFDMSQMMSPQRCCASIAFSAGSFTFAHIGK